MKTDFTIWQLKKLKLDWLAESEGFVKQMQLVASELGDDFMLHPSWRVGKRLEVDFLTIYYGKQTGKYEVSFGEYQHIHTVIAYAGGDMVCRVVWADIGEVDFEIDNFIVLGAWQEIVRSHIGAAMKKLDDREYAEIEAERQYLLKQLLIK